MIDQLISWLITRLQFVYGFFVNTLGTPSYVGVIVCIGLIFLFFYSLFDLYRNRNKGNLALMWLIVLLLVPLSTVVYLLFGSSALHAAPVHTPKGYVPVAKVTTKNAQKKYFLGTTTALGSVIATIALVAGLIALAFFVLIVIAYIQCLNDPKCM